ncbi:nuclear transport factor 2 family protein [Actinoallomurus iriomotensis]|uniref:SnoaL-like domain-containing protein n=1 Tax=Actinoallomurus iriomotensis TaxID=478107 RepID=A0A9W6RWF2_9ACTN|nr:nuclear transport factor 2 family protein [Actinoallomurus iriomotensis]GLY83205.1 hypothetical protein Airi02_011350 [Actinoallomurus iriomotensis]
MSTPTYVGPEPAASHREIANLIARYAELVDGGDFAGLGALLADATFTGSGSPVSGAGAIEEMFRGTLIVYGDGTPRTKHVTTNLIVELDGDTAAARSYVTVYQALPELPLQPIAVGRYHDRFAWDGTRWRFAERRVHIDLVGDVSRHLRAAAG